MSGEGIFAGDLIIKAALELSLSDIRKNNWLIEDMFASLIENPFLAKKYGYKEIQRAKDFINNNDIPVFLHDRIDKEVFPCITLSIGTSNEQESLATLGDLDVGYEEFSPQQINKPIAFIIAPFDIISYDSTTGIVEIPENIVEYKYISSGMLAVNPSNGNAFKIIEKAGKNGFSVEPGLKFPSKIGIIPQYQIYRAKRERSISIETYHIGCHVHGDPSLLIFLYAFVKYSLYRYKQVLLEAQNFQLSKLSVSDFLKNGNFSTENVHTRYITLTGQVEESWIKTPHRLIEFAALEDANTVKLKTGLKIISKKSNVEEDDEPWITVD